MKNPRIACFAPVIDRRSKVLILGSVPGGKSLELGQYYGHPQNQFWKIMAALLGVDGWKSYAHKTRAILQHNIALWDVIDSCERKGSMDANIRNHKVNDLPAILKQYPNIKVIFCDSGTAHKMLMRHYPSLSVPVFSLPSPSSAHAIAFERKLARWKKILEYV